MGYTTIALTEGMRNNLFSLQNTSSLLDKTQRRLSTGKKVNSALDNAVSYFTARAFSNRATDLNALKDNIKVVAQNLNAADTGVTAISSLLDAANSLAKAALATSDQTARRTYAEQFDEILTQIDNVADDSSFAGTNLLNNQSLTVEFSEVSGVSTLTITGTLATSSGLGVQKVITTSGSTQTDQAMGTGKDVTFNIVDVFFGLTTYSGSSTSGPVTLTADISSTPDMTATVIGDAVAESGGNVVFGMRMTDQGTGNYDNEAVSSYSGDSKTLTATVSNFDTLTADPGDTLQFFVINVNMMQSYTVGQRTFGTNYTAAELSNIKVGGVAQTAGVDYNLVTRSDGDADIVFTSGHAPADGVAITADVTAGSSSNAWETDSGINTSISQVKTATQSLRTTTQIMFANSNILTIRLDFGTGMIRALQTGSDNLTLADMNEEGANMLALETRQSMGVISLSLASQANQAVMQLF